LPVPKDSLSLKLYDLPFDFSGNFVVIYNKSSELEAYTLSRSLNSLLEKSVRLIKLEEFLLMESPYVDLPAYVLAFLDDINDIHDFQDVMWALNGYGYLVSCNQNVKKKGKVEVINFSDDLCEVNLSLSIINKISSLSRNKRAEEIRKELANLSTLKDWLKNKISQFDFSGSIVLSPILSPARGVLEKYLGRQVGNYEDFIKSDGIIFITTTADLTVVRRREFSLRREGFNVKEIIFDVDPLLAPIYLILLTYVYKQLKGGV
jgi:hypothetical protein